MKKIHKILKYQFSFKAKIKGWGMMAKSSLSLHQWTFCSSPLFVLLIIIIIKISFLPTYFNHIVRYQHTATCRVLHVTKMTGSSLDDWIFLALWLQPLLITLKYKQYRAIIDLHTFHFTIAHALGFSLSTSCLLATDLNTETITSNHYAVVLLFRLQSLCTPLSQSVLN
jgi:hypothetical protein